MRRTLLITTPRRQPRLTIENERVRKIIMNNTINLFFKLLSAFGRFQTITVSEYCLIKLLPYILFAKYIYILALEMASPGNQHCANCIGTLSFPVCVSTGRRALLPTSSGYTVPPRLQQTRLFGAYSRSVAAGLLH